MQRGVLFRGLRFVAVIVVSLAVAGLLMVLRPRAERQAPPVRPPLVTVQPVRAAPAALTVEAFGTVVPRDPLTLVAEVRGRIEAMDPAFTPGGRIGRGTVLMRIDPRPYRLEVQRRQVQVEQLEAELARLAQQVRNLEQSLDLADADAALARAEQDRIENLARRQVVPPATRDQTEQRYLASLQRRQSLANELALAAPQRRQLAAGREMARLALEQARLDLERSAIAAPFDGWVLAKAVENGQHVGIGQVLGRIYREGRFDVSVDLPAEDWPRLETDADGRIAASARVVFHGSGGPPLEWAGQVARTEARVAADTRTLPLVVEIDAGTTVADERRRLRPGMFVSVRIEGRSVAGAIAIPADLIQPDGAVLVARDGRLHRQPVAVTQRSGGRAVVTGGLADGDLVIVGPVPGAREGMALRTVAGPES